MRHREGPQKGLAMRIGFTAMAAILASACASAESPPQSRPSGADRPVVYTPPPARPSTQYPASSYRNAIGPQLEAYIHEKWRAFPGKTGIAVQRIDGSGTVGKRLDNLFPQQSVSKLWVALTVLDHIDRGELRLDAPVRIGYDDFTMFQSIVKKRVERQGTITETVGSLLELAVTKSDNTANDKLMWLVGGPGEINRTLATKNIRSVRFGPGERKLQSAVAGFRWDQSYGPGNRWFAARRRVPASTRQVAMRRYLNDPMDGATPRGMVSALAMLARGELLSPSSTRRLMGMMGRSTSGPKRLKAGVPGGWQFGHKTGTGQSFGGMSTGYNDVGIMTAPDGTRYAVAVMLANTTASVPKRMTLMQSISRAVGRYHGQ
ncbi:MAG: serine hydrolase [Sphingorhabdus sp.]